MSAGAPRALASDTAVGVARRALPRWLLYGAFALSGAAALSYEVVWTRALSVVVGSTTYALSSILATFMLGLACGGVLGGRVADRAADPLSWFAAAELGIGALGIASHLVIDSLPSLYLPMYRAFHLSAPTFFIVQIGLCSLVMLAPTVLMGTTFPLVTKSAVASVDRVGSTIGSVYGVNTLGAVVGSLATGFVLVPGLGLRGATFVAAVANLVVGAVVLLRTRGAGGLRVLVIAVAYLPLGAAALRGDPSWLVNFYTASGYLDGPGYDVIDARERATLRKVYEREGPDGHVAAFKTLDGHLVLQVGGKFEGTGAEDVANTLLLAFLPAAAHPAPERMLVVGLGAGSTLAAAREVVPGVELAEISEGVLEAVRRHGTPGVLDGIPIHRDDARNLLLRSGESWDVISSEPSYPTDFAVANLFSIEFYELAARRLSPGGVFCQWLPYYMLTNDDVTMMVKTFASVFPHASLWRVSGSLDLLLLGSRSPFARSPDEIAARVESLSGGVPLHLVLSRSPDQVAAIARAADVPLNTDDRPRLEFRVARNLRVADLATLER